jgi:hypothetical protein
MISYRWRRFAEFAQSLICFLDELGVKSWIDVRGIEQSPGIPTSELKRILADAVTDSRLVLFFETEDALELPEVGNSEDANVSFNWQFFELQFAQEVLYAYPNQFPSFLLSELHDRILFYNQPYLAYLLALTVGRTEQLDIYWNKYFGDFPLNTASAYNVWKFHTLPSGIPLPRIIDPGRPDARPNKILEQRIKERKEIVEENRFSIVPGIDDSERFMR